MRHRKRPGPIVLQNLKYVGCLRCDHEVEVHVAIDIRCDDHIGTPGQRNGRLRCVCAAAVVQKDGQLSVGSRDIRVAVAIKVAHGQGRKGSRAECCRGRKCAVAVVQCHGQIRAGREDIQIVVSIDVRQRYSEQIGHGEARPTHRTSRVIDEPNLDHIIEHTGNHHIVVAIAI